MPLSIPNRLILLLLSFVFTMPLMAQDATSTPKSGFDPESIPNFGKVLLSFEIPKDNRDFLLGRWIAVQPDLSRIYVGSGASGIVYIFDDKGQLLDEVDTIYEFPPTDMILGPDGNLYIAQVNNIYVYDRDGQRINEIEGNFSEDISYIRIAPLPDKTLYSAKFFGEKDQLYHLDTDGTLLETSEQGYFALLNGDEYTIFDQILIGQDGFFYYFSDATKTMYQIDDEWELVNQYSGLITEAIDPQRTAILVDADGNVLLGDFGGVQVFGDKEQLVTTIKLESEFGFVHHMAFADNGILAVVQPDTVSIIQYGLREDESD